MLDFSINGVNDALQDRHGNSELTEGGVEVSNSVRVTRVTCGCVNFVQ